MHDSIRFLPDQETLHQRRELAHVGEQTHVGQPGRRRRQSRSNGPAIVVFFVVVAIIATIIVSASRISDSRSEVSLTRTFTALIEDSKVTVSSTTTTGTRPTSTTTTVTLPATTYTSTSALPDTTTSTTTSTTFTSTQAVTPSPTPGQTRQPTVRPTVQPTRQPTVRPTVQPTRQPTVRPTAQPTPEPTVRPTVQPTPQPTVQPTVQPTPQPTVQPTVQSPQTPFPTASPPVGDGCTCCATYGDSSAPCTCVEDVSVSTCTVALVGTIVGCGVERPRCGASGAETCKSTCAETRVAEDATSFLVSAGNSLDTGAGFCCGGTLGGIVQRTVAGSRRYYALSNAHVFAPDGAIPRAGQELIMPSLVDSFACRSSDPFALLTDWVDIRNGGMVQVDGAIAELEWENNVYDLEFGAHPRFDGMNPTPRASEIGMAVKKYGYTSGFTRGEIVGINAQISVAYPTECGSSQTYIVEFSNQIIVQGSQGSFSAGGDSGSVVVEDVGFRPRPVGLLFAGNAEITVLNEISDVLERFSAEFIDSNDFRSFATVSNSSSSTTAASQRLGVKSSPQLQHVIDVNAHDEHLQLLDRRGDVYARFVGADPKSGDACVYVLVNNTAALDDEVAPTVVQGDVMVMYQNTAPIIAL